jgi:hypothetical protein
MVILESLVGEFLNVHFDWLLCPKWAVLLICLNGGTDGISWKLSGCWCCRMDLEEFPWAQMSKL